MALVSNWGLRYVNPYRVRSGRSINISENENLGRIATGLNAQRWEFTIGLEPTMEGAIDFFLDMAENDDLTPFTIPVRQIPGAGDAPSASINASIAQGATAAVVRSSDRGNVGNPKGRFFTFAGDKKLYVIKSYDRNGGNLIIFPQARMNLNNVRLNFNPEVEVYFSRNFNKSLEYNDRSALSRVTMEVVENV